MSSLVKGATLLLALPAWPVSTTAPKVAAILGVTKRSAQRDLRKLEAAGLAFTDWDGLSTHTARWWRA